MILGTLLCVLTCVNYVLRLIACRRSCQPCGFYRIGKLPHGAPDFIANVDWIAYINEADFLRIGLDICNWKTVGLQCFSLELSMNSLASAAELH